MICCSTCTTPEVCTAWGCVVDKVQSLTRELALTPKERRAIITRMAREEEYDRVLMMERGLD